MYGAEAWRIFALLQELGDFRMELRPSVEDRTAASVVSGWRAGRTRLVPGWKEEETNAVLVPVGSPCNMLDVAAGVDPDGN